MKGAPVAIAFAQHSLPAQSSLRAFQNQVFKQLPVIVNRHTPFPVMIVTVKFLARLSAETSVFPI